MGEWWGIRTQIKSKFRSEITPEQNLFFVKEREKEVLQKLMFSITYSRHCCIYHIKQDLHLLDYVKVHSRKKKTSLLPFYANIDSNEMLWLFTCKDSPTALWWFTHRHPEDRCVWSVPSLNVVYLFFHTVHGEIIGLKLKEAMRR